MPAHKTQKSKMPKKQKKKEKEKLPLSGLSDGSKIRLN
jgi:hypothetical protein